jgi:hypothetical protein
MGTSSPDLNRFGDYLDPRILTELLWCWLELLTIPIVLAAGAFWFNIQTRRRESEQELARRKPEQELALQARESEQELARRERENDRQITEDRVRVDPCAS